MKKVFPIVLVVFILSCAEPVEIGISRDIPRESVRDLLIRRDTFMDSTIELKGILKKHHNRYYCVHRRDSINIETLGLEIPDSLIDNKATIQGMVFYHEEVQKPYIAADYLKVRLR